MKHLKVDLGTIAEDLNHPMRDVFLRSFVSSLAKIRVRHIVGPRERRRRGMESVTPQLCLRCTCTCRALAEELSPPGTAGSHKGEWQDDPLGAICFPWSLIQASAPTPAL